MADVRRYIRPDEVNGLPATMVHLKAGGNCEYRGYLVDHYGRLVLEGSHLYVHASQRGKGIGELLVREAREIATEHGVTLVETKLTKPPALVIAQRVYAEDGISYSLPVDAGPIEYDDALQRLSTGSIPHVLGIVSLGGTR